MPTLLSFLLRALLVAVGIVFALSLAVVFVLVLGVWLLRAGWCKLTGRPVVPFAMRMGPRGAFEEMMRRAAQAQQPSRTPRADAADAATPVRRHLPDVTDVEPK